MGQDDRPGWVYSQSSGTLTHDGEVMARGYSGMGAGKNNPGAQSKADSGPVPQGRWSVSPSFTAG